MFGKNFENFFKKYELTPNSLIEINLNPLITNLDIPLLEILIILILFLHKTSPPPPPQMSLTNHFFLSIQSDTKTKSDHTFAKIPLLHSSKKISAGFSLRTDMNAEAPKKTLNILKNFEESKDFYLHFDKLEEDTPKPRKTSTKHLSLLYRTREKYVSEKSKSSHFSKVSRPPKQKGHSLQSLDDEFEVEKGLFKTPKKKEKQVYLKPVQSLIKAKEKKSRTSLEILIKEAQKQYILDPVENSIQEHLETEDMKLVIENEMDQIEKRIHEFLERENVVFVTVNQREVFNEKLQLKSLNNVRINTPEKRQDVKMSPMLKRRVAQGGLNNPILKTLRLTNFGGCNNSSDCLMKF